MKTAIKLRSFQIGKARQPGEGLRIGATRRPPRGVSRSHWVSDGYFDVWLPVLAPSAELLRRLRGLDLDDAKDRQHFFAAYEREMRCTEAKQCIELLAVLCRNTAIAVGCYCSDESRCHRSRLKRLIENAAADTTIGPPSRR